MDEGRLRMTGVRIGSSARSVEQTESDHRGTAPGHIRAGSSARMAEDEKRSGASASTGTAGFSLRGQGGRVLRHEEAATSRRPATTVTEDRTAAHGQSGSEAAVGSRLVQPTDLVTSELSPVSTAPLQTTAGRLQSMFRALFKPGGPSANL